MTQVTRLFDFPYYQQDKYTSIPDALNTKQDGDKTSTQEYIEQQMQSQEHIANGNSKNDKIAVIFQATERMEYYGYILQTERKTYPYTQQSPKMIMNTY
jgi:long-chain acyl-CoA synthetase